MGDSGGRIVDPDGCRWCGIAELRHGQRWHQDIGRHGWVGPTSKQRLDRMLARRAARAALVRRAG